MNHTASFVFKTPFAAKLYEVLVPEIASDPGEKSNTRLIRDDSSVSLLVEAEDAASLRASLNMWLRLVNVSHEVLEL
ncbi:MAG TPA: KEOPS complex subunit Pcc1 [Methanocorpusculum sp.]|nr:KEOPS complex subunit Pcc1 [Methanocorpusculum sp.]HJJ50379.1 KEOPS complex subunit Pcc1 [Methanocorpusculum sp.]HKL97761.1 KEOPS complex subunit Pcc1 [Methanocorpusculum sp.]